MSGFSPVEMWIPPRLAGDREQSARARSIVGIALVAAVACLYFMAKYHRLGAPAAVEGVGIAGVAALLVLPLLRFTGGIIASSQEAARRIGGMAETTQRQRASAEAVDAAFRSMRGATDTVGQATEGVGRALEALERQLGELEGFLAGWGPAAS